MVALIWLRGLLAHRRRRLVSTALGVAVAVALLASIGTFLSSTTSQMTGRAVGACPSTGRSRCSPARAPAAVLERRPAPRRASPARCRVGFAPTRGLLGGDRRVDAARPGPAACSGCPTATRRRSRRELRMLAGRGDRRAAGPADRRQPARAARRRRSRRHGPDRRRRSRRRHRRPARRRLAVPAASARPPARSPGAAGQRGAAAPASSFDRVAHARAVVTQIHVGLDHALPGSPSAAYTAGHRAAPGTWRRSSPAAGSSATTRRPRSTQRPPRRALRPAAVPVPRPARRHPRRAGDARRSRPPARDRRRRDAALLRDARRDDPPADRPRRWPRRRSPRGVGIAVGLAAALADRASVVRHRELRRATLRRDPVGRRRGARRASLIAAAIDRAARPGATPAH